MNPPPGDPIAPDPAPADPAPDPLADTLVIPGERVGPITRTTDRQQLAVLFGEERLRDEQIAVGEGFREPGTWVDLGHGRSLAIIWTDETQSRPYEVRHLDSQWHTPEGVHVGMTLDDVRDSLGTFRIYGFAWDYGGTLNLEGSHLNNYHYLLHLRLRPTQQDTVYTSDYPIMGDTLFPGDHPRLDEVEPVLDTMIVVLNPHQWEN
jgi:hypothetical protein